MRDDEGIVCHLRYRAVIECSKVRHVFSSVLLERFPCFSFLRGLFARFARLIPARAAALAARANPDRQAPRDPRVTAAPAGYGRDADLGCFGGHRLSLRLRNSSRPRRSQRRFARPAPRV